MTDFSHPCPRCGTYGCVVAHESYDAEPEPTIGGIFSALADRVATLEEQLAHPLVRIDAPPEWTDAQLQEFADEWRQQTGSHEIRLLPPGPVLTPETAKALLSECVTVVSPGETLVIRVPEGWTSRQADEYQEYADAATDSGRIPFRVLVVIGAELGVARPEPDNRTTPEG